MVAKTPDYIIADCGCPQWNASGKEIADFDTLKHFAISSIDKNKKLLPQRETIADYYVQVLANKLNAWEAAASKQRETIYQINKRYDDDPSIVKCMKTQRNEATKRSISQQQSNYTHTSSRPHISDKRRRSRVATTTAAATANTALDSDLDVF